MSPKRSRRRREAKEAVLRNLALLAQDRHPQNQTLLGGLHDAAPIFYLIFQ